MFIILNFMQKLRCAVAKALEDNGISGTHKLYQPCGAKLLTICRTFVDVSRKFWLVRHIRLLNLLSSFFFSINILKYAYYL